MKMRADNRGFTLIEVLVSMVLVSMITLIIALALRISMEAWSRGEAEGEQAQINVALPSLLEKQLLAVTGSVSFHGASSPIELKFSCDENEFSFFTLYSPQGTPWQGLMRVTYIYDEQKKTVKIYEQLISDKDDIKDMEEKNEPDSNITGISSFSVRFLPAAEIKNAMDDSVFYFSSSFFQDNWEESSKNFPAFVELDFSQAGKKKNKVRQWLLKVGGTI